MNMSLRPASTLPRVYLYRQPVDFRKSYRGLSAIFESQLGDNPFVETAIDALQETTGTPKKRGRKGLSKTLPRHQVRINKTVR